MSFIVADGSVTHAPPGSAAPHGVRSNLVHAQTDATHVVAVLAKAGRRQVWITALTESLRTVCVLLALSTAALLLGTALVSAWWIAAAAGAGAAAVAWRTVSGRMRQYQLAQLIDGRLQSHDALSTACFLLESQPVETTMTAYQLRSAGQVAQAVRPAEIFPLRGRIYAKTAVVLLCGTSVLLILRLTRSETIDFRPSLVPIHFAGEPARALERRMAAAMETLLHRKGAVAAEFAQRPSETPQGQPQERSTQNASMSGGDEASQNAQRDLAAVQRQLSTENHDAARDGAFRQMREAMQGLMSKLGESVRPKEGAAMQKPGGTGHQSSQQSKQREPGNDAAGSSAQRDKLGSGATGKDAEAGSSSPPPSSEPQAVEKARGAPLGSATQPAQEASNDAQSGAGRNDGRKDLRAAEQLKAIGKLTEILGKRSAALTGEMTLDKSSGTQHLETQDTKQVGAHSDRGDELHRDEIPPEYRDYIRAYMDAAHKEAAAAGQHAPKREVSP